MTFPTSIPVLVRTLKRWTRKDYFSHPEDYAAGSYEGPDTVRRWVNDLIEQIPSADLVYLKANFLHQLSPYISAYMQEFPHLNSEEEELEIVSGALNDYLVEQVAVYVEDVLQPKRKQLPKPKL